MIIYHGLNAFIGNHNDLTNQYFWATNFKYSIRTMFVHYSNQNSLISDCQHTAIKTFLNKVIHLYLLSSVVYSQTLLKNLVFKAPTRQHRNCILSIVPLSTTYQVDTFMILINIIWCILPMRNLWLWFRSILKYVHYVYLNCIIVLSKYAFSVYLK